MTEHEAKEALRRFFEILESKEESDSGTVFSPVYISSVRVMYTQELNELLPKLRAYAHD